MARRNIISTLCKQRWWRNSLIPIPALLCSAKQAMSGMSCLRVGDDLSPFWLCKRAEKASSLEHREGRASKGRLLWKDV